MPTVPSWSLCDPSFRVVISFTPLRQMSTLVTAFGLVHDSATLLRLTLVTFAVSKNRDGGGWIGVTAFEGCDGSEVPTPLLAVTVNVYETPLVRPATVHDVPPDVPHVWDPGEEITL